MRSHLVSNVALFLVLLIAGCTPSSTVAVSERVVQDPSSTPEAADEPVIVEDVAEPDPVEPTAAESQREREPEPDGPQTPLIELLSLAPYPDDGFAQALLVDVDRLYAAAGIDHDETCNAASVDVYFEAFVEVTGPYPGGNSVAVATRPFNDIYGTYEELPVAFGYEHCEIEAVLQTEYPQYFARVEPNVTTIVDRVSSDPVWSGDLTVSSEAGVTILDWGQEPDFERATSRMSPVRFSGNGGQLVVVDHAVARPLTTSDTDRILDPLVGRMIDRPQVRELVDRLEALGAHSMILTDTPVSASFTVEFEQSYSTAVDRGEALTLEGVEDVYVGERSGLAVWRNLAIGSTQTEAGDEIAVVVLGHLYSEQAQDNAERFAAVLRDGGSAHSDLRWSDRLRLESIEVDGLFVTAVLSSVNEYHPFFSAKLAYDQRAGLFLVGTDPADEE